MFPKISLVNVNSGEFPSPPFGITSIGSYLIKKKIANRKSIQILDLNLEESPTLLISKIKKHKPNVVGISSMTLYYPRAVNLAKKIRTFSKNLPIIAGGIHISIAPHSLSNVFDMGVIGEGEETFYELMLLIKKQGSFKKAKLRSIPGLVFWENGKLIRTRPRKLIASLDSIPFPDWELFSSYLPSYFEGRNLIARKESYRTGYMFTSRGCPFRCVYCSTSAFWKKLRFHSAKYVAKQTEYLVKEFKINRITIQDDIFNFSKKRIKEIISGLDKRRLLGKVEFRASIRSDLVDKEFCRLFKKMGGVSVFVGFESGSNRILKFLKNNTVTVQDNKNAALLLNKHKIEIQGSIILGSPGETQEDMKKSIEFSEWFSKLKYSARIVPYTLTPYPGTEIWKIALEKGLVTEDMKNWGKLDIRSRKPIFTDEVTEKSFTKFYKEAENIFHKVALSNFIRLRKKDKQDIIL